MVTQDSTQASSYANDTNSSYESDIKNSVPVVSTDNTSSSSAVKDSSSNAETFEEQSTAPVRTEHSDNIYIDNTQYGVSRSDLVSEGSLRKKLTRNELTLPAVSATNNDTPRKDFIDVSSHNGSISVASYQTMKKYGVKGVVVKLTEATSYKNPYAKEQIANAKKAGLNVSAYHYS